MNARRYAPKALALGCLLAFAACSGNGLGGGGILGGNATCQPGTDVTLANPRQGQTGVSTNPGQIEIVANGNNNSLAFNTAQWYVVLTSGFSTINGGSLVPYSDPGGYHPYASDFFYTSSISGLPAGTSFNVALARSDQSCTPAGIGSFST